MSDYRSWRDVKAKKARIDAENGHVPVTSDQFVYTRGPHEGEPIIEEHVCVPECYEDQSAALENATWVDSLATTNLVQATSIEVNDPGGRAHKSLELRLLVHPSVDVEDLKLRLVAAVLRVDLELHDARSTP